MVVTWSSFVLLSSKFRDFKNRILKSLKRRNFPMYIRHKWDGLSGNFLFSIAPSSDELKWHQHRRQRVCICKCVCFWLYPCRVCMLSFWLATFYRGFTNCCFHTHFLSYSVGDTCFYVNVHTHTHTDTHFLWCVEISWHPLTCFRWEMMFIICDTSPHKDILNFIQPRCSIRK